MKWNATLYREKHNFVFDYGTSLIELLAPQSTETILDVGCGTGELTSKISARCKKVVGLDRSTSMIEMAQTNFPNVSFTVADAADFKLDTTFDALFSNAALHWVKDYTSAVKCMYQHLKPGGRLVLEFGGKGNVGSIVNALKRQLKDRGYEQAASKNPWYFPSIAEFTTLLEQQGFFVSFAHHYDRPTQLAEKSSGIVDWILMFGNVFFEGISEEVRLEIAAAVQEELRDLLFHHDHWLADYKRLRVVAIK